MVLFCFVFHTFDIMKSGKTSLIVDSKVLLSSNKKRTSGKLLKRTEKKLEMCAY